uniref:TFIIS N-terminal domain-containing protein n=1 Tax=Monodelphis domestica TaxID=13616 RepID=A0A5F8HH32_MONDO
MGFSIKDTDGANFRVEAEALEVMGLQFPAFLEVPTEGTPRGTLTMAKTKDLVARVLKLKEQLDKIQDSQKETGIGKTVNGFRKHTTAGDLAKTLVNQWKKLISPENGRRCKKKKRVLMKGKESEKSSIKEDELSEKFKESKRTTPHERFSDFEEREFIEETIQKREAKKSFSRLTVQEQKINHSEKISGEQESKMEEKYKSLVPQGPEPIKRPFQSPSMGKPKKAKPEKDGTPKLPFEYYLNYDQISNKKKNSCPKKEQHSQVWGYKKLSLLPKNESSTVSKTLDTPLFKPHDQPGRSLKKIKNPSLEELIKVPLPKFLPEISLIPSPPYVMEPKAEVQHCQGSDAGQFTGRRLNSKMHVYSGSKMASLPKMLSLYKQCIHVLQNNIDLLHEVGGVPFDILEPVLECCTPKQLSRLEDYNPTFIELADHLWKRHCQREFKNEEHQDNESWREMYFRLFEQREEKLKTLTKNIIVSQSEKPKGRQIKMAYVQGMAKPPRELRHHPENCDSSKVPLNKLIKRKLGNGERSDSGSDNVASTNASVSGGSQQDAKKVKRMSALDFLKEPMEEMWCFITHTQPLEMLRTSRILSRLRSLAFDVIVFPPP